MPMRYKTILLVDDDDDDWEIFQAALHKVSETGNYYSIKYAKQALEQLESQEVVPDLIFLDLNMPAMNGLEFLTQLKKIENSKDIPVIIFSTSSHKEIKEQAKELGAHDFITKPHDFNELVDLFQLIL